VHGDAVNPRTREELEAKFRALASEALEARRAEEVVEIVARLEDVKDVRAVTALLTSAS
jgi:2-methylcitrate dehydratase PrpD